MKQTRLAFTYSSLRFPPRCPNCLGSSAETPVVVERNSGEMTVSMSWPHCGRCAADERWRRRRLGFLKWALIGGLSLSVISVIMYFQGGLATDSTCGGMFIVGLILSAAAVVATAMSIARRSRPDGAPRLGAGVAILRGGASLTGGTFLSVILYNEEYAGEFRKLNELDSGA